MHRVMYIMAFTFLIFIFPRSLAACEEDPNMRLMVKYIGEVCTVGGAEWLFGELAKNPQKATCSLVKQLGVTHENRIGPWESENKMQASSQVWRIRALRFLTCRQDYLGVTLHQYDSKGKTKEYWDHLAGIGPWNSKLGERVQVPYFSTRMSSGVDYLAPEDAQKVIIRQWREWLVKNGTNAGCTPNATNYNQWYF